MERQSNKNEVVYLAGGCFWGLEKLMSSLTGVTATTCGYANGSSEADATYQRVCAGDTGFRETVRVEYDPARISIDALLLAFFHVIDPTARNRQGNDIGSQYQSGIYYTDEHIRAAVERIAAIEAGRNQGFAVEIGPLQSFYPAEDYHQHYLDKQPNGYCHISRGDIEMLSKLRIDPGAYQRPAEEEIRRRLSEQQYQVTQHDATEKPFENEFWDKFPRGLYVDIVTGEPLFSSEDKFASPCGWPAFSKPIEAPAMIEREDLSRGRVRTEVRSRAGDSHLGHVFANDPDSPNGVRYCINSAALRFIPYQRLEDEGYGYLLELFDEPNN